MSFLCFDRQKGHFKILEHDGQVTLTYDFVEFTTGLHFNPLKNMYFKISDAFAYDYDHSFYVTYEPERKEIVRYEQKERSVTYKAQCELVFS